MDRSAQNSGTSEVRERPSLRHRRARGLDGARGRGLCRPARASSSSRAASPTRPTSWSRRPRDYVLRRKPPGQLLPGAHAVDREYRVITALGGQGFPVARSLRPVPRRGGDRHALLRDGDGRGPDLLGRRPSPRSSAAERPAYFDAMNATIAALHSIDPGGGGPRRLRQARQLFRAPDRAAGRSNISRTSRPAGSPRWTGWSSGCPKTSRPTSRSRAIIHGDFRCDNMVFHADRAEGARGARLGAVDARPPARRLLLSSDDVPDAGGITTGLAGSDLAALNIPGEADYVAAYCRRTGRDGIPDLDFYMAFNLFRLAGIVHGIKGRVVARHRRLRPRRRDGEAARAARRAGLGAGEAGRSALIEFGKLNQAVAGVDSGRPGWIAGFRPIADFRPNCEN